jgi:hypothetical protein
MRRQSQGVMPPQQIEHRIVPLPRALARRPSAGTASAPARAASCSVEFSFTSRPGRWPRAIRAAISRSFSTCSAA